MAMLHATLRAILVLGLASALSPKAPRAFADGLDARALEPVERLEVTTEAGRFSRRSQRVLDPASKALQRRSYTVLDLTPSRGLDFAWAPDDPLADRPGRVSGEGRVTWRLAGKPVYDLSA